VASPRFAEARTPPIGESAAGAGASTRAAAWPRSAPGRPPQNTRQIALSSEAAAAVQASPSRIAGPERGCDGALEGAADVARDDSRRMEPRLS
jgi:hypothetical protein